MEPLRIDRNHLDLAMTFSGWQSQPLEEVTGVQAGTQTFQEGVSAPNPHLKALRFSELSRRREPSAEGDGSGPESHGVPAGLVGEQTGSGGTHASARTPVSAHWFPVRGPTRILAPRTEIGCACRRGGGRGCVLWRGGLPSTCSFACVALCCVSRGVTPTASTGPGWYCMCYGVLQHQVPLSWLFWVIPPCVSLNAALVIH